MNRMGGAWNERGYSLLELLVVLAVLALGAAVTLPRIAGTRGSVAQKAIERVVLEELRELRSEAIRSNSTQWIELGAGGKSLATSTGHRVALPAGVTVVSASDQGALFYPSGRSSGLRWRIEGAEGATILDVDWLTGRASRSP